MPVPSCPGSLPAESVRRQLASILESAHFASSERRRSLLVHLVEETLAGRAGRLKAYSVGTSVLGRGPGFDPQSDAIVRVELHRLRGALDSFYRNHPAAPVVISIPRGRLAATFSARSGAEVPGPSIGVCLPYRAGAADPALAEGLTGRLVAALTHFEGLRVVGPLPAVSGGDEATALAERSKVRFLLRCSLRTASGRLRVELQLTDAPVAEEVWSRLFEFDAATGDPFAIEDAIVDGVVGQVAGPNSVISRRLGSGQGLGAIGIPQEALRAHESFVSSPGSQGYDRAREQLEAAARSQPEGGSIAGALADVYLTGWWLGLSDDEALRRKGEALATRGVQLDPRSQNARLSLVLAHFIGERREPFRAEAERTVALNPYNAVARAAVGLLVGCDGDPELGLSMVDDAIRRNPGVPPWWRLLSCLTSFRRGEYEAACTEAQLFAMPGLFLDPLLRAATLGPLGRREEARAELDRLRRSLPDLAACRGMLRRILHDEEIIERLVAGLASAGAPVETRIHLAHRA